ncbi:MAG: hypothetical protein P1U67_04060 [Alcanivoracaceae bacterium]|nr:hypothetical protein [Alcanivoracaceae bacterium]
MFIGWRNIPYGAVGKRGMGPEKPRDIFMQSKSFFFALAVSAVMLAGCNGQEDFSGARIGGPIIDGTQNPDPNFNPSDPCSPRVVGNFINKGNVDNIGYFCGGYLNYTGQVGIQDLERDQQRFVCPLFSNSVTFFIGGNDARESLGTAYFRRAEAKNVNTSGTSFCEYDSTAKEFVNGSVYDADGPYLFTVADIFDGPVRNDVITDGAESEQVAQNISALLTGLDANTSDGIEYIDFEAHRLIFEMETTFAPDFFDKVFSTFVSAAGAAQEFLDLVAVNGAVGSMPVNSLDAETALTIANESTAAGLYRFDLFISDYLLAYQLEQAPNISPSDRIFQSEVLLSDLLVATLQTSEMRTNPADAGDVDDTPILSSTEFLPFAMVDRHGRVLGGGAFSVAKLDGGIVNLCDNQPLYMALDGSASLQPDLTHSGFKFEPIAETGEFTFPGRLIDGVAYSGLKSKLPGSQTDYDVAYDSPAHVFDASKDRSLINTNALCNSSISNQVVLGFRRQGLVMPTLDSAVMGHFFSTPARYTVNYLARTDANDAEPDKDIGVTGQITIHQDGTILTDLNNDGNAALDSANPVGEYVIGMVSSVIPGTDSVNFSDAVINVVLYNFGPKGSESSLTRYGSHFRARLVPDKTCGGGDSLFLAGDKTLSKNAYWFDTYNITNWLRATPNPTPEQKYEALRTRAYGYVEGIQTNCTP